MGREIMQNPAVLVVSQPTWGVDAGAAAAIHQALVDLAASGSAIVVISQDLDELLSLCDTLAVINEGRLSPAMKVADADIEEIGLLMGGVHGDPAATANLHRRWPMRIKLEKRPEPSTLMAFATPIASVLLTMAIGVVVFDALGIKGEKAVIDIFLTPLLSSYKWQDVAVKAAPLIIIALGLSIGNRAQVWNIGAEGQYIIGALAAAGVGIAAAGRAGALSSR